MDFIGNSKTIFRLNKILKKEAISHAYIFSGPESVGKFLLAKMFAASVIRSECRLGLNSFSADRFIPDLSIIEPETEEKKGIKKIKDISIEAIRDVQRTLALYPSEGKRRVLIVNDAHRMSLGAQNALLKTLEEPSDTAMIILVVADEERLLPTVRSRCQRVGFQLVSMAEMKPLVEGLRARSVESGEALILAMGRPGRVVRNGDNSEEFKARQEVLKSLRGIGSMGINDQLTLADKMSKDAGKAIESLELWQWALHEGWNKNENRFAVMDQIGQAIKIVKTTNASLRLVLENLFLGHSG